MSKPILTTQASLQTLMANEFHDDGSANFVGKEPKNYIERLTDNQVVLLNDPALVPPNSLTVFITVGDGFLDRPIGADFAYVNLRRGISLVGKDSIRPNASFAMFYKSPGPVISIELVFYTRFFVVSYMNFRKIRDLCRELDSKKMTDTTKRDKLRIQIFDATMERVKGSYWNTPNRDWQQKDVVRRYGLVIGPVCRPGNFGDYFPYRYLKDGKSHRAMEGARIIHV